jgi:hypothetical protein
MKLIVLLRDPVDRAYSHYQHMVRTGKEPLPFEAAIDAEASRLVGELERLAQGRPAPGGTGRGGALKNHSYIARSQYAPQLQDWLRHFDRSQLLVLKAEQVFAEPGSALDMTARFLGLEAMPPSNYAWLNRGMSTQLDPHIRAAIMPRFADSSAWLEAEFGMSWPAAAKPL